MADLENKNIEQNIDSKDNEALNNENKDTNTPTMEDLMAEIAQLKADNSRNKNALDKALREKGEITKQLRAKQTAEETAAQEKAEKEQADKERIASLEEFQAKTLAKDRYLAQGMSVEMASKAAEYEIGGDMDSLSVIQKQHTDSLIKAEKAKWLKSRPEINSGSGAQTLTKEQFDAMDMVQKSKLYRENRAEYDRLNS